MTLEAALMSAVATLAGVVAYLFKLILSSKRECEEDRQRLWAHIEEQDKHIAALQSGVCHTVGCSDRKSTGGDGHVPKRPTRRIPLSLLKPNTGTP